ncbi:FliC/FljB family flagellin [Halomonas salinarum]|uniref:FliC/FljB family flagellin n=1 Tax=Halomonas salinarum TaxID=1158993 RepID=UPI00143A7D49|nr:FliC/FljB family flagellin [Halomonas salinarum]
MSMGINTNITAMIGQQNLSESKSALTTSMERLSSGLRINSAKDDAAGQAIANRMTSQITGLGQAQRNANDGISVAQTAEGALNQVNDNLQRVRELTVQAQNGTNSDADLQSIQDEIGQRLSEIDRISEETDFNGVKVLSDGESLSIQVGANDGESISIDLQTTNSSTLGLGDFSVAKGIDTAQVAASATASARVGEDLNVVVGADTDGAGDAAGGLYALADGSGYVVENTTDGTYHTATLTDDTGNGNVDVAWDSATAAVAAGDVDTSSALTTVQADETFTGSDSGNVYAYSGTESGAPAYVIQDTSGAETAYYEAEIAEDGTVTRGNELADTPATADPLAALDNALKSVDQQRSDLGAIQNRFESAITNLSTTETNLSAARSRIEDADYATEVADMTKNQILQQAGTSVLAQANQLPQSVLSLLG